jgi:D-alanyl-D-alanine carboxypeptidase
MSDFPKWRHQILALCVFTVALAVLAVGAACGPAESTDTSNQVPLVEINAAVREAIEPIRAADGFPGVVVGYVLPDGRAASVAVGFADAVAEIPMQVGDRMLSGSIGKTYVSAVTLQLVNEGLIGLDDPLSDWFGDEEWFERIPNANDLTVRHLMTHTSGIPRHIFMDGFIPALIADPDRVWEPEELISYILDVEPHFAAGEGFSYADTNYILVGMIIEKATGNTYYEELQSRILDPFELEETSPSDHADLAGLIPGHLGENDPFGMPPQTIVDGRYAMNPQFEWTGGGLVTTAGDLALWTKALYEQRAFDASLWDQFIDGTPMAPGAPVSYGLGVMLRPSDFGMTYGHGGMMPGYLSEMEYFIDYELAVALQINADGSSGTIHRAPHDLVGAAAGAILSRLAPARTPAQTKNEGATE